MSGRVMAIVTILTVLVGEAQAQWSTPPTSSPSGGWYTPPVSTTGTGSSGDYITNGVHYGNSGTGAVEKVGRMLRITMPASGTGTITEGATTGGLLTGAATSGVFTVGLTTNAVLAATAAAYDAAGSATAVSNALAAGAAAGLTALQDFSALTGADVAAAGGLTNAAAFATAAQGATADSAVQPTDPTYTQTVALAAGALQDVPTLQQAVTAGGTATNMGAVTMVGDLTMGANAVSGQRFGESAGLSASGLFWGAFGVSAGNSASGNDWGAFGYSAGSASSGSSWGAFGYGAGVSASGNSWGAFGYDAGVYAVHTNSHSFGRFAGRTARGDNRMYLDVYAADPDYAADGATNDTIFMDSDGTLYLGGGAGRAENPNAGVVLRGPVGGDGSGLTGVQPTNSALTDLAAGIATSLIGTGATQAAAGDHGHANYVATNDAAYLAALTNAAFAAQDGITITDRTLNIGTNLFGGTGSGITLSDATNAAQAVMDVHTADTTDAHLQSAIGTARTVTTIAVDQAAGTQTVTLAWGEVTRCRILATNSGVVVSYDWPALPATNRSEFLALEHWNPNSRSVTFADTTYWSSNGVATTDALTLGNYAEVSVKGSTYYYAIRGMTNATELGAP